MRKFLNLVFLTAIVFTVLLTPVNAATSILGAGRVNTQSSTLNVRSAPSSASSVKASLSRNSYLTLLDESGAYWYVQYAPDGYGYCHKDYIYRVSASVRQVKTKSGRLRVRASADASATITGYLNSGELVTVHTVTGDFAKIIYNGNKTGYVSKGYLVVPDTTPTKYRAISLNVPDYKQTDPRWSNTTLGSSGQTIGKIGCATTALAMTESYRTGTTIHPNAMAKRLSYTSAGAVYWPSSYNIITTQNGYLEVIYNALKSGKPVIIGAKNSGGGQHYVVVRGVKQTTTLSAESFYINDPGSSSRTTLNQFFGAYPNFYKLMYIK